MNIEDKIHLEFIHNRLIDFYGENRNTDFVKKLLDIINEEPKVQTLPKKLSNIAYTVARGCSYNDFVNWWDAQV
jgi:hypothetical protein